MDAFWLAAELEIDGVAHRFGPDESDEGDLPSDIQFDTQNPGGYGPAAFTIHRPEWATREALLFNPGRFYGPGGQTYYEGRVSDVSQVDPDSIRIDLEGWATHLDDDEFFRFLGVHNDLTAWEGPSVQRQLDLIGAGIQPMQDGGTEADTTGLPALVVRLTGTWAETSRCEMSLAVEGLEIDELRGGWKKGTNVDIGEAWTWQALLGVNDVYSTFEQTANLEAVGPGTFTLTATEVHKVAAVLLEFAGAAGADGVPYDVFFTVLSAFGAHGLTPRALADGRWGLRGSDALRYAIDTGAPLLTYSDESIEDSTFDFAHLVHTDGGVRGLIETITAHGSAGAELPDWGVYEDCEFFWRSPGTHGRLWRVRRDQVVVPNEDGPTAEERFGGVVVAFQDGAGKTFTVGPVGSGADTEDARLEDTNENNPALKVPNRRVRKDAGITFAEGAILLGQAVLAEQNALTRRGTATISGYATDEAGNEQPACAVRACDRLLIEDEDATEPEIQSVNSTSYAQNDLTVNANLGAAPHRVDIVLARLAAALGA